MKNIFFFLLLVIVFNNIINAQIGSVQVYTGWNLIGSLNSGVTIEIISTEPPGIITGSIYGYAPGGGYYIADSLKTAHGYWVKVSQDGLILIETTTINPCQGLLTVYYEGKTYNTLQIGTQCWLRENLDVGTMLQGTQNQSNNSIIEKYCHSNDPFNCATYGGLYQWNEAMQYVTAEGTQGICPAGWHIPTYAEIQTLFTAVNGDGNALKAVGQGTDWGAGTNTSGFTALLSSYRNDYGNFGTLGGLTYFWSSTDVDATNALNFGLDHSTWNILLNSHVKDYGFAVRCLKD